MPNILNGLLHKYEVFQNKLSYIFKIDMKYIMGGGSLLALTQVTSALFGFVTTIMFANYLPPESLGVYRYILATYALLALISLPGVDTALIETISKGNLAAFRHSIFIKLKWGLLGTIASWGYSIYSYYSGHADVAVIFVLVGIFLPFMEALSIYSSFLNGTKKYGYWTITEIANQVISTIAIFFTIYFTSNTLILIISYFVSYIFIRAIISWHILKKFIINDNYDPTYLNYGKAMTGFQFVTRGIASIDQMVLFHFMGPVQVAMFSIANAIPTRFQSVLRITGTLTYPKITGRPDNEIARSLIPKMIKFGFLILLSCIFYAVVSPIFFKLFFPKYLDSVSYSQALMFYALSGITYPFGSYLVTHRKVNYSYGIAIINFIVKAICLIIFVPMYGIWGAVISVLASSWTNIIIAFGILWRNSKR